MPCAVKVLVHSARGLESTEKLYAVEVSLGERELETAPREDAAKD